MEHEISNFTVGSSCEVEQLGKSNNIRVENFTIDIDRIRKEDLLRMRILMPKAQYKLLKNRKSARLHRIRKKAHHKEMNQDMKGLQRQNNKLRKIIEK